MHVASIHFLNVFFAASGEGSAECFKICFSICCFSPVVLQRCLTIVFCNCMLESCLAIVFGICVPQMCFAIVCCNCVLQKLFCTRVLQMCFLVMCCNCLVFQKELFRCWPFHPSPFFFMFLLSSLVFLFDRKAECHQVRLFLVLNIHTTLSFLISPNPQKETANRKLSNTNSQVK